MRPSNTRATHGSPSKTVISPVTPARGPSAYRCLRDASERSSTLPSTWPPSTSRWAPIQRTLTDARSGSGRSPGAGGRRLESEPGERRLTLPAHQEVEKGLRQRRLLGPGDHRDGIEDRPVRVLGRAKGFLHLLGTRGRVGRVDEARFDLAAGHIVQGLADVLREDELRLEPLPNSETLEALLGILAGRHGLWIADDDLGDPGIEQVGRLGDVDLRVGGFDVRERVWR